MVYPRSSSILSSEPSVLVGRDREQRVLIDRCQQAHQGQGGVLWLAGEAGIGKTALMFHLRAWAESNGFQTLWGRHLGHNQTPPLHGLREALVGLFGIREEDGPREVEQKVKARLETSYPAIAPYYRNIVHFLEPFEENTIELLGDKPTEQQQRLYHLLFRLLSAISRERPLILFLDDLHWADALSLDCLAYLGMLLIEQPIWVIGAYRPEESDSVGLRRLLTDKYACIVPVPRLDLQATTQLATHYDLGENIVFCRELHRRTEGIPLFVEQWLRLWQTEPEKNPLETLLQLPESVARTIERRLQFPSEEELRLMQSASVLGEEFSAEMVAQVEEMLLPQVLELLADLEARGGLVQAGASKQERLFSFHHPLIRQVVYDSMPTALRQRLHLRAGEILDLLSENQPELVFAVAHHYTTAQQQAQAVGALFKAGQRVFALRGYEEAQVYYQQALEGLKGQTSSHRSGIEEGLGNIAWELKQDEMARSWWEAALQGQDHPLRRCLLYYKLGGFWSKKDLTRQWHYLQLALRESISHPHAVERAQVLDKLVLVSNPYVNSREEEVAQAVRYAAQALRILRHHPDQWLLHHLLRRLLYLPDKRCTNLARRKRLLQRMLRLAEQSGRWEFVIEARMNLASMWRGVDLEAGIKVSEEALYLAEDYLPPYHTKIQSLTHELIRWNLACGDQDQALRYWERLKGLEDVILRHLESEERAGRSEAKRRLHESYQRNRRSGLILLWQTYTEEAWEILVQELYKDAAMQGKIFGFVRRWSCMQRLALITGKERKWYEVIARLHQEHPTYFESLGQIQWELKETNLQEDHPLLSQRVGVESFEGRNTKPVSRYTLLAGGEVEIIPGPEVGLSWIGCAPCLLRQVEEDFLFETRISAASHPQRAGGIVVWQGPERFIRFASGVDHIGQITLAWNEGKDFRFAGVGFLPEGEVHLRLMRTGTHYESFVSPDGRKWYTCGNLEVEGAGPVEVGLFAECNYEYGFPQPFSTRFADTSLWTEKANASRSAHLYRLPEVREEVYGMVGQSRTFREFCTRLQQISQSHRPVLLYGETGTGKELAARALHQLSGRTNGPYLPFNAASIPEQLIESELFGYKKGAFTGAIKDNPGLFARASGGSLFIDEIGELPIAIQTKLLRALAEGEILALGSRKIETVDVFCIAATNRDLSRDIVVGQFRPDLFFRLGFQTVLPPLRTRKDDIPLLTAHFITLYGKGEEFEITTEAMERLVEYAWPGNVRELENTIERAMLAVGQGVITAKHLTLASPASPKAASNSKPRKNKRPPATELVRVLKECGGNVTKAAGRLQVDRKTIYRWLEEYHLEPEHLRTSSLS